MEDTAVSLSPVNETPAFDADKLVSINFVPHTVYVLCGPTMCGKSTFARSFLRKIEGEGYSANILSSDGYRAELLWTSSTMRPSLASDADYRHSSSGLSVSRQAFDLLFASLKAAISFPVCTEAVIIDTTGFDISFREDICKIAKSHNYRTCLVTFDYKSRADYLMDTMTPEQVNIANLSRDKFRRKILPNLKAAMFDERIRVKTRYSTVEVVAEENELSLSCEAVPVVAVIGDSHENVEALSELIQQTQDKYPGCQIVHVGDYLDKGNDTAKAVEFMYDRVKNHGDIVIDGNHEAYVCKRLRGEITACEVEETEFTSLAVLLKDKSLADKVLVIESGSLPFLILDSSHTGSTPVYITHAPCRTNELGKVHGYSLRNQRNYRTQDRTKSVYEEFAWLYNDSESIWPLHIFGHTTHLLSRGDSRDVYKKMVFRNRVFLDTGAVYGGHLSAAIIKGGRVQEIIQVPGEKRRESTQPTDLGKGIPNTSRPFSMYDYDLDIRDMRLLRQLEANDIRYISGTMAPGPSTKEDIESLEATFDYLQKQGVKQVIMQPKWMGSRAQLYLFEGAPEKTFMVSRGGWKIRNLTGLSEEEFKTFLLSQYEKHKRTTELFGDVILDGELLPWSALGEGLITQHFTPYLALVADEIAALASDEGFKGLTDLYQETCLPNKAAHAVAFNEVLNRYAKFEAPSYKPFSILSWTRVEPGYESIFVNEASKYCWVADSEDASLGMPRFQIVNLTDEPSRKKAHALFQSLTVDEGMEGVVLKPVSGDCEIPFMKVRSEEYLRLVYGYDWMDRRQRLCWQKNISGKVRVSKEENKLAQAMLNATPETREEFAVKMIGQMKVERTLDPRL